MLAMPQPRRMRHLVCIEKCRRTILFFFSAWGIKLASVYSVNFATCRRGPALFTKRRKVYSLNQHHRWSLLCSDQDKNIANCYYGVGGSCGCSYMQKDLRASCCPPDTGSHSMLMTFEYPKQTDSYSARRRSALRQGNPAKSSWHSNENKWDNRHYHCNRRLRYPTWGLLGVFHIVPVVAPTRSLNRSIDAGGSGKPFPPFTARRRWREQTAAEVEITFIALPITLKRSHVVAELPVCRRAPIHSRGAEEKARGGRAPSPADFIMPHAGAVSSVNNGLAKVPAAERHSLIVEMI